jgi:hypothetical protein
MDLGLLCRVLWRHKIIVGIGFIAAIALAFLSFAKVSFAHGFQVHHRQAEQWQSTASLLVTERGFPFGRTVSPDGRDPTRFSAYATLYARLATSDSVRKLMLRQGAIDPSHEFIGAAPVLSLDANTNSAPLPLVSVWTIGATAERSFELTRRLTKAFVDYLSSEQRAHSIPHGQRVSVSVVVDGSEPLLVKKRSKTLPIVVFLTVAIATCGLAFIRENLQRRHRPVGVDGSVVPADAGRRSA